jgi:predicted phage baseplate assembly protein
MSLPCNCCRGAAPSTPLELANRPGLSALVYRIGTYASFFETMKTRLSSTDFALDSGALPLAGLTTRNSSDPAIALLDAWAIVADVLTFYQERIANEGYLRTATERKSVVELARLVGYALRPGVAASVYLAYTLEQSSQVTIPAGSRVQNVPGPGELPQSFETSEALDARGGWNNLAPRLTRPQVIRPDSEQVYAAGLSANLKANDPVLIVASAPKPRRVASIEVEFAQNRTKVLLLAGPTKNQAKIALPNEPAKVGVHPVAERSFVSAVGLVKPLTEPPADHPANALQLSRSVARTFRPEMDTTPALLKTFNPQLGQQLYAGLRNAQVTPPLGGEFHALRVQAAPFGHNAPLRLITNADGAVVATEEWPLVGSLSIKIALSSRSEAEIEAGALSFDRLRDMFTGQGPTAFVQIATSDVTTSGVVAIKTGKTKIGKWDLEVSLDLKSLEMNFKFPGLGHSYDIRFDSAANTMDVTIDSATSPIRVPLGESSTTESPGRRILVSSTKGILIDDEIAVAPTATKVLSLDMAYDQIIPGSWILIERADTGKQIVTRVTNAQKVSLNNYGMSSRVTQLTLEDDWLDPKTDLMLDVARNTVVSAQSEQLVLAEEPITDRVLGHRIELGDLYGGLKSGRWLVVQGERADVEGTSGVTGTELVMLDNVEQGVQQISPAAADAADAGAAGNQGASQDLPGDTTHSFLQLSSPLNYEYKRETATIYGNVIQATHGETRKEVLGSGDGAQELQQFSLHQAPLTYVAVSNAAGTQSTLAVRVNDILWHEVETLAEAGPNDRVYTTRADANGKLTITFGNGRNGMRLPTGQENVVAYYRSGVGAGGNADSSKVSLLATRPLGVKAVINPIPASGGADGDTTDQARQNAPIAVTALDRLVSVSDYGDFARTFAGIGKASSQPLSSGHRQLVFVTIAGTEGTAIDKTSMLYVNLVQAFQQLGDPHLAIEVEICKFMLLVISAQVKVLPDSDWNHVAPQIRATLLDAFGFDRQELAESVPLSRVVSAIQNVRGVQYVNVQVLDSISESDTESPEVLQAKLTEIVTAQAPKTIIVVPPARLDPASGTIQPAALAFLSAAVPDTLILAEVTS